jgi:hypothetical protein
MQKRYAMIGINGLITASGIADDLPEGAIELPAGVVLDRIVGGQYKDDTFTPLSDLEWAKKEASADIASFAEGARASLTQNATSLQIASWASKEARAQRVVSGTASDSDNAIITAETEKRGKKEDVATLAQKQVKKAEMLMGAIGIIDGMTSAAISEVKNANSTDDLDALLPKLKTKAHTELIQMQSA